MEQGGHLLPDCAGIKKGMPSTYARVYLYTEGWQALVTTYGGDTQKETVVRGPFVGARHFVLRGVGIGRHRGHYRFRGKVPRSSLRCS